MNRKYLLQYLFVCILTLLALPARANLPSDEQQLQAMQVDACRALGSLMLLRGEGFQENHANQLKADLAALDAAVKSYAKADDGLRKAHQALLAQIQAGTTYGPKEEDLPWTYLPDLSRALRDFHGQVERFVPPDEFKSIADVALAKGFALVSASPLTRSSHHAGEDFAKLKAKRLAGR